MAVSNKCRRCAYASRMSVTDEGKALVACLYILITGTRRPCAGGDECTVFKQRKIGQRECKTEEIRVHKCKN